MYSNISDCDEGGPHFDCLREIKPTNRIVYNFWEPLHYILKGYGFQTWEVSPAYGIRSWAYIFLHYPFVTIGQLLSDKKVYNASSIELGVTDFFDLSDQRFLPSVRLLD